MENHMENNRSSALDRPGYAKRFVGCLAAQFALGFVVGLSSPSDPVSALQQMFVLVIICNVIIGGFFASFTYRRALDCQFGKNGKAWVAALAALPAMVLPNVAFLVFAVMMFIKSAQQREDGFEFEGDEDLPHPVPAGE